MMRGVLIAGLLALARPAHAWFGGFFRAGRQTPLAPQTIVDIVIVLYVVIIALLVRRMVRLRADVRASATWTPAASRVIESRLDQYVSGKGGRTMWPVVVYEYEAGGRVLRGQRATFGEVVAYNLERRAQRRLAALVAAASVRIFHDPGDPTQSVIERSVPVQRRDWVLLGLCFGGLGVLFWLRMSLA